MNRLSSILIVFLWLAFCGGRVSAFMSADPLGHASSMSLYDYCNGDPVNGLDPDGRLGVGANVEDSAPTGPSDWLNNYYDGIARQFQDAVYNTQQAQNAAYQRYLSTPDYSISGEQPDAMGDFLGNAANFAGDILGVNQGIKAYNDWADNFDYQMQMVGEGFTVATSSRATAAQRVEGGAVMASAGFLLGMNVAPGGGEEEAAAEGANPLLQPGAEYSVRINPVTGQGPMAIDTSTFTSGETTLNGGIRNSRQFWQSWSGTYGDTLSDANLARINAGRSPVVDEQWIQSFPEHSNYMDETLIHHHLDYGPQAIPLPESVHSLQPGWSIWHQ